MKADHVGQLEFEHQLLVLKGLLRCRIGQHELQNLETRACPQAAAQRVAAGTVDPNVGPIQSDLIRIQIELGSVELRLAGFVRSEGLFHLGEAGLFAGEVELFDGNGILGAE